MSAPVTGLAADTEGLRAVLDSIGAGVYAVDTGGAITWVNREAEQLLGRLAADLVGRATNPVRGPESRLRPWLERSLADLNGLRMTAVDGPDDVFFAAGAPWYLTLFGRDSLWTARMLLPVDAGHAMGTLRTLARRAGTTVDVDRAEAPGKILHALRRAASASARASSTARPAPRASSASHACGVGRSRTGSITPASHAASGVGLGSSASSLRRSAAPTRSPGATGR